MNRQPWLSDTAVARPQHLVIEVTGVLLPNLRGVRAAGAAVTQTVGLLPRALRVPCPHVVAWTDDTSPANLCRDCGAPLHRPPMVRAA